MIFDIKIPEGYIKAYIVFQVVDKDSRLDKHGEYLFINGIWIHERHRHETKKIFMEFVKKLFYHEETQNVVYVYWQRDKNGKYIHYPAWKLVKKFLKIGEPNGKYINNDGSAI